MLRRLYHYITRPIVLRRIVLSGQKQPRVTRRNPAAKKVFVKSSDNLLSNLKDLCSSVIPAWDTTESILIKINLNTADTYPASTDPAFLIALLDAFIDKGFTNLWVGDCSSMGALPTYKVAARTGIVKALRGKAKLICFDKGPWVKVNINGKYLTSVVVPRVVFETNRIVHLANIKSHSLADFSFGIKLGIGYMHPLERWELHREYLQEKIAEMALAVQPDLTIIDGRFAFISGGPTKGRVEKAGIILWGENPLAVDVEAYKRLYALKKTFGCVEGFSQDPFEMRQFNQARRIDTGNNDWQEYSIVEI